MILGINPSHDVSFCFLDDKGFPVIILEEERFNRIKHTSLNTHLALKSVINRGIIKPEDVSQIVYSFEIDPEITKSLMQRCYDNVGEMFGSNILSDVKKYSGVPDHRFSSNFGFGLDIDYDEAVDSISNLFPHALISGMMHHRAHAASAFYPSPFDDAVILVIDGSGRLETTTIWDSENGDLKLVDQIDLPNSIGILYWLFSNYIALEEGQAMGLAAYGRPIYADLISEKILSLNDDGSFALKTPLVFWFNMETSYAISQIEEIFGRPARWRNRSSLTQFHADIAASIQYITEQALIRLAIRAKRLTGRNNLCLSGGVIQNCVANGQLLGEKIFDKIWIQPMANDSGTSLGAALARHFDQNKTTHRWRMTTAQCGLSYPQEEIAKLLDRLGLNYYLVTNPAQDAAKRIDKGQVIGWFQGRAEVGPRALGGRSLLSNPINKFNYYRVNDIKQRQVWRPLAPSMLREHSHLFVENAEESPFMILSFSIKPEQYNTIPAACHTDGSARVQTVSTENNPIYYELIRHFNEITNIPVVLNTSFNLKSEPIVQSPLEALRTFLISEIDCLFMENYVVDKKPTLPPDIRQALLECNYVTLYDAYLSGSEDAVLIFHPSYNDSQKNRMAHLTTILEWLGLSYSKCDPVNLIANTKRPIISLTPWLDKPFVELLPNEILERTRILVVDRHLFISEISGVRFLDTLNRARKNIIDYQAGRHISIWASDNNALFIQDELSQMSTSSDIIKNLNGINPRDNMVVTTMSMLDANPGKLTSLGFNRSSDILVWDI